MILPPKSWALGPLIVLLGAMIGSAVESANPAAKSPIKLQKDYPVKPVPFQEWKVK